MIGNRLYKYEKLCSKTAVDMLFKEGNSAFAYPLRAAYRVVEPKDQYTGVKFLITIPKKKIRSAVDRVKMRRRVREAYRLNRNRLLPTLEVEGKVVEVAFIYLSNELKDYAKGEAKMIEILDRKSVV